MLEHLVAFGAQVTEPAAGISADVVAGLAVALLVIVVIVRFFKVILYVLAFAFLAILLVGFLEVQPHIAQVIEQLRAAGGP